MKSNKSEFSQKLVWMPIATLIVTALIYLTYVGPSLEYQLHEPLTNKTRLKFHLPYVDNLGRPLGVVEQEMRTRKPTYDQIIRDDFRFNINDLDVMVFLHMQKTGGTIFGKHLVQDLDLEKPCSCRNARRKQRIKRQNSRRKKGQKLKCMCFRPNTDYQQWLFSRYSTGWKCGVHADWTELTHCVDGWMKRQEGEANYHRYFYITMLRNPIDRYISEFLHVQRGATWKRSKHWCGGHDATKIELPKCYSGKNWKSVTLDEFLSCESNLASNRQTRMLADLAIVGCYDKTLMEPEDRAAALLESAKSNLAKMSYFGLMESQKLSQYIFEETFNLRFLTAFKDTNHTSHAELFKKHVTAEQMERIKVLNALDMQLYEFAKGLLDERFKKLKKYDKDFTEHYNHLGEISTKFLNFDNEEGL